jgi:hypothetical protein
VASSPVSPTWRAAVSPTSAPTPAYISVAVTAAAAITSSGVSTEWIGPEQPGGVAEDAQHQGVAADGVVGRRGEVGEHPGAEADQAAAGGAEHQGEPYHHEQHQVGHGTGEPQPAEDADLDDQGHDDQDRGEQEAVQPHEVWGPFGVQVQWDAGLGGRTA